MEHLKCSCCKESGHEAQHCHKNPNYETCLLKETNELKDLKQLYEEEAIRIS